MALRICATGDLMLLEKLPEAYDLEQALGSVIRDCDVRITNLETVISDWNCCASTFCGGEWVNSEPDNLDDIAKFGFNLYGCANNHCMDYSFWGLWSTQMELGKRKLKYAGIGNSLSEASAPAILSVSGKKVAFISVASTTIHTDAARAGDSRGTIPSRPGLNPLRIKTKYSITPAHMKVLKEIAGNTFINGERDNARNIGSLPKQEKGTFNFGGILFEETNSGEGKITACDERDLVRILKEIDTIKSTVDYVIVQLHSHQIKHASYNEPDYFMEEFAHKCIDHGACAVIGGGTHQLKPIEIYKGRPIFYSLGNFVFQEEKIRKMPSDFWDKYGYDMDLELGECKKIKTKNGTIGLVTDKKNYLSIIPVMEFDGDSLAELSLIPISLNFEENIVLKGLPRKANKEDFDTIKNTLEKISVMYGTEFISYHEKIGVNVS